MFDYLHAAVHPKTGGIVTTLVDLCMDACAHGARGGSPHSRGAVSVQVDGTTVLGNEL
jgi:hypothetical protein